MGWRRTGKIENRAKIPNSQENFKNSSLVGESTFQFKKTEMCRAPYCVRNPMNCILVFLYEQSSFIFYFLNPTGLKYLCFLDFCFPIGMKSD